MPSYFTEDIEGFCPEQNCEYQVEVTFREYRSLGQTHSYSVPVGMECDYLNAHECHRAESQCPLWLKALRMT